MSPAESYPTALITGASGGIGHELTKQFARDGYDVVLVARSQDRLKQIGADLEDRHDITATVISKDLSVPGAAEELYNSVTADGIHVDTLVNNAGFGIFGRFTDTNVDRIRDLIQVNLVTITELSNLFAQPMRKRGDGQILNVSSLSAVYPTPMATVYAATKSYLLSFSVALADEMADDGITVSVLCPGVTDTPGIRKNGLEESGLPEKNLLSPAAVAESGYTGLHQEQTVIVPGGVKDKLLYHLPRVLPKSMVASFGRAYWEKE